MLKILYETRTNEYYFADGEFKTVDEAVKKALEINNCCQFTVVEIVAWRALPTMTSLLED
jgi:hypothetical protein